MLSYVIGYFITVHVIASCDYLMDGNTLLSVSAKLKREEDKQKDAVRNRHRERERVGGD